jgi:hypothetical protein
MVLRATAFCASTSAAREKLERGVEGLIAALRSLS